MLRSSQAPKRQSTFMRVWASETAAYPIIFFTSSMAGILAALAVPAFSAFFLAQVIGGPSIPSEGRGICYSVSYDDARRGEGRGYGSPSARVHGQRFA